MLPAAFSTLRAMDTDRLGWSQTFTCDHCQVTRNLRIASDAMRCSWLYVCEIQRCEKCHRPVARITFSRRQETAEGEKECVTYERTPPSPKSLASGHRDAKGRVRILDMWAPPPKVLP